MALYTNEPSLSEAMLNLELHILNDILVKELLRIKAESEHLKFELAALNSVVGDITAFPKRFSKRDLLPVKEARDVFFHQNARFLRTEQHMSYQEIGEVFDVPSDLWLMYEDKLLPTSTVLLAISKSVGISAEDLLHKNLSAFVNDWSSEVFGRIQNSSPTPVVWNEAEEISAQGVFTFRGLAR